MLALAAGCTNPLPAENPYDKGVAAYDTFNDAEAVRWFRLAAEQDDARSKLMLGMMYLSGEGAPKDDAEGMRWLKLAADQGDADAQVWFGFFRMGQATKQKSEGKQTEAETMLQFLEAFRLFELAADQGNAKGQAMLGEMYFVMDDSCRISSPPCGDDMLKEFAESGLPNTQADALRLIRHAADQGDVMGQLSLAGRYDSGKGVPEDDAEAARLYRLAADQGSYEAQHKLAMRYHYGDGVAQNSAEAARWYTLAADQGYSSAQISLASMHRYGEGVPENYVEAYKWYNLLSARPYAGDVWQREKQALRSMMTRDQIAEAQRLSSVWKPSARKLSPFLVRSKH